MEMCEVSPPDFANASEGVRLMDFLKVTVSGYICVYDLKHFAASSLEEAAANQQEWVEDGSCSVAELLELVKGFTAKVVPHYSGSQV